MENQITVMDVREVIKTTRAIAPILNKTEFIQLMSFYSSVLTRYEKEEYPSDVDSNL